MIAWSSPWRKTERADHAELKTGPLVGLMMAGAMAVVLAAFPLSPVAALGLTALFLCSTVATRHVDRLMIAVFALMPFQQSIVGESSPLNVCLSDLFMALLLVSTPLLWLRRGKISCGPVTGPLLVFLLVMCVSAGVVWHGYYTVMSLVKFFRGTAASILIFANADLRLSTARRCYTAFLVGINVVSVCSIYTFLSSGIAASMYTLGIHKNALGPTYGCGVAIALVWWLTDPPRGRVRVWLILTIVCATIGLVLTLSRGGWISTGVAVLFLLVITRQFRLFVGTMVLLVPLIFALWWMLPQHARDYAGDVSSSAENVQSRLVAIEATLAAFRESPVFGQGIDFGYNVEPHNVFVLTLGETGVLGLSVFIALCIGGFATFRRAARYARHDAMAMQVVLMATCVFLISLVAATMDVYWRRGIVIMAWCGVGLAAVVIRLGREGMLTAAPNAAAFASTRRMPPTGEGMTTAEEGTE